MRDGRIYWTAPESQFYAEPKRLAQHGYLTAAKQPGRTHERTHYTLTDRGREALARVARDPGALRAASRTSRSSACWAPSTPIGGLCSRVSKRSGPSSTNSSAGLRASERRARPTFRTAPTVLRLNRRLAQRIVDAHRAWLDEVEQEL